VDLFEGKDVSNNLSCPVMETKGICSPNQQKEEGKSYAPTITDAVHAKIKREDKVEDRERFNVYVPQYCGGITKIR
jgi:hypothetical protein